jgi:hypothetical protein
MEAIHKDTGMVKGIEILHFPEAEIMKMKGDSASFAAMGPLSVLHFKDYNRFVLQLNDWKYPLLHRLPIKTLDMNDNMRSYMLPALNGFNFKLSINNISGMDAIANFEEILKTNSGFGGMKHEKSPDDKLKRAEAKNKSMGFMEAVSQTIKNAMESVKTKGKTMKDGTKNINSTKRPMDIKSIKNKNFRKSAHAHLKKDMFVAGEKETMEFMNKRRDNPNMRERRELKDMEKTSDSIAPAHFIFKEDIEEAILNNKDIIC